MLENNDRRVRRTKRMIRETLLDILKEKSISKVSVSELCRKADINRNTFYTHYKYPEEVLFELEEEFLNQFQNLLNSLELKENNNVLIIEICKLIKKNPAFSYVLLNDNNEFLNRLIDLCHDRNIYDWQRISDYTDNETAENFYRFTLSGTTAIIKNWCRKGFKESPEELVDFITKLSLYGMNGFVK